MEFESIRIFSIINDLPESVTPRGMVNAVFAISGITHPKACENHDFCNPEIFIDFISWLEDALP